MSTPDQPAGSPVRPPKRDPQAPPAPPPVQSQQPVAPPAVTPVPRAKPASKPKAAAKKQIRKATPVQPANPGVDAGGEVATASFWHPKQLIDNSPPWMVSLVFHMLVLLILGVLAFNPKIREILEVVIDPSAPDQESAAAFSVANDDFEPPPSTTANEAALQTSSNPSSDPTPQLIGSSNSKAMTVSVALSGRSTGMKTALMEMYGATRGTENAVQAGLEWLKKNQRRSGLWSLKGPYRNGSRIENNCAATAMALLAFQGAGNTHQTGKYKEQVARGWKAMLKLQDPEGNFYHEGVSEHSLYSQAQATMAICEMYGMTRDKQFRTPAMLAVEWAVRNQDMKKGGWRYHPGDDSDMSVSGWFVMALQSAKMAGLDPPKKTWDNVKRFLKSVQRSAGSRYAYVDDESVRFTAPMTAEGLLCRQYMGWRRSDPRLLNGVQYLLKNPINWNRKNVYYWYYATQVLHHMEGEHWVKWNLTMRNVIPKVQEKAGRDRGSWHPRGDRFGVAGGRLYSTCLCIYMLEVYYRHLPIYKYRLTSGSPGMTSGP